MTNIKKFCRNEDGATAIEYGLIAAATGLTLAAVAPLLVPGLTSIFTDLSAALM